jgi:hypothetical protein
VRGSYECGRRKATKTTGISVTEPRAKSLGFVRITAKIKYE